MKQILKNETLQIVQVYAPTTDYDDETIEKFYDDLEEAIDRKNNTHVIVMGDFNANVAGWKNGERKGIYKRGKFNS